jgi:predicted GNAT family acetyltransferase
MEGVILAMNRSSEASAVIDNAQRHRFEMTVDDQVSYVAYRRNARRLVLVHTEVPDELSGRGIGGALVEAAIDTAAKGHLTVVPECPFARAWLKEHPQVAGRVAIDWSAEVDGAPPSTSHP